ncbi:hypothetical protein BJ508DRAFT_300918 [Ascobolus immersus RN42]|uniref:Uncharacterized protein n=1 Tax=Ascobolus immersus RN42 TaxID=1160509 RepID=A0A3N4IPI9_ASCIM|nr:hypothetical protein BJ508DRAFT_300918 [Ascobolus immersus RN42]
MHLTTTTTLLLTLTTTTVLAAPPPGWPGYQKLDPPVLLPPTNTTSRFTLPSGIPPLNITNGTYTGFSEHYPVCSRKCAVDFFAQQQRTMCESQIDPGKYPEATRYCICQQAWGGMKVSYEEGVDPMFVYEADFVVCAERACRDERGRRETEVVGWRVRDYCERSARVENLTVGHAEGGLGQPKDSSLGTRVGAGKVGAVVAAGLVALFASL